MGMNISRCEAQSDPTIVPPPPPTGAGGGQEQSPPPPQEPPVCENLKYNPGTFEDLSKKCKEIFPMPFEGAKLLVNKPLSQYFNISHTLTMSNVTPSGYRFGSTFVSPSMITPQDPFYVLMADMDPNANLNAQGVFNLSETVRVKYITQIMNSKFANTQITTDIRGKDWTLTGTTANPNLFNKTGVGVLQYLQAVTARVALGAELIYQKGAQEGGAGTNVCARYTGADSIISGNIGSGGLGLCYWKRLNEEIQVGVEYENSHIQQQTSIAVGYQCELAKANFSMKAMVDNNWTVTAVMEKRLVPMPMLLSLCGSLNHVKNQFRLGCALTIGV